MTLNLIGVSEAGVYQSSDFRLSYHGGLFTDWDVQKIVPVVTLNWAAWVQFTGLARAGSFDTEQWIREKIIPAIGLEDSIAKLLQGLLTSEALVGNRDRLTFTVVGFEGKQPFAHLISNFESITHPRDRGLGDGWKVSTARLRPGKPFAIATGSRQYVNDDHLRLMRRALISQAHQPQQIQRLLADINRKAARTGGKNGPISEGCFTARILPDGTGEAIPHDVNPGGEYLPKFAILRPHMKEADFKAKIGADGKPLPRRLIGITMSRSEDRNAVGQLLVFRNVQEPTWLKAK